LIKATLRKTQEASFEVKGNVIDAKRKKQAEKAEALAVDIQCGEVRKKVKYSKKWQKMKRRIKQEFHLKWKRWILLKWTAKQSSWEKLPRPYGALEPEGTYRLVIHAQDRNRKSGPGKI
jgi:hypothetical protein